MKLTPALLKKAEAGKISLLDEALKDLELYASLNLKIKNKAGKLVPFEFNPGQQVLHDICEKQKKETGKVRVILLKYRQGGGSTYIGSRLYKNCGTKKLQSGKVIAHDSETALMLFSMYQRFYDNSIDQLRPKTKFRAKSYLYFENPTSDPVARQKDPGLESSLGVLTANTTGAGRGGTFRHLHCSEVPLWPDPANTLLGLLNTIPSGKDGEGTEVFLESTARGVGDLFYQMYWAAKNREAGQEFIAVFLPWYLQPEYANEEYKGVELTDEEKELHTVQHEDWEYLNPATGDKTLSIGQILWRRETVATKCDKNLSKFKQEYPLTDKEAFQTSGDPLFDPQMIDKRLAAIASLVPEMVGDIEPLEKNPVKGKVGDYDYRVFPNTFGPLTIWKKPVKEEFYVISADVGAGGSGGDLSVIDILDSHGFHCAQWRGLIEPAKLAVLFYCIGKWYNWAYGSPETNNHGEVCIERLTAMRYRRLHHQMLYDKDFNEETERVGWRTTRRTKYQMLDVYRDMFRDDEILINSVYTLQEQKTFVRQENSTFAAQKGCRDDCVMSMGIACMMLQDKPRRSRNKVLTYDGKTVTQTAAVKLNNWTGYPE